MTVRIVSAGRHDRDRWPDGVEELVRGGRSTAMVRDLEDVDPWEAALSECRVDVVLDVAGQEEPTAGDLAEEDDRDVVDGSTAVGRLRRHPSPVRPEHAQGDRVEPQSVA
jgi:hypothetical protein